MTEPVVVQSVENLSLRALNRYLAHEVFFWTVERIGPSWKLTSPTTGYSCFEDELPPYSTDISFAMRVVEELIPKGTIKFLAPTVTNEDSEKWLVTFEPKPDAEWKGRMYPAQGIAPTLPVAICKMTLAAICGE